MGLNLDSGSGFSKSGSATLLGLSRICFHVFYCRVKDVKESKVLGLAGLSYVDKTLPDTPTLTETRSEEDDVQSPFKQCCGSRVKKIPGSTSASKILS